MTDEVTRRAVEGFLELRRAASELSSRQVPQRAPAKAVRSCAHLRRARDLADRRFADPITLDDMAAAAACSRWHLIRAFRSAYGETPGDYLSRRRIERAMTLLRTTEFSVTQVCNEVSFSSLGTFSRRFKEVVGTSPSEYRRMALRHASTNRIPACFAFMNLPPVRKDRAI